MKEIRRKFICADADCKNEFFRSSSQISPINYCSRSCAVKSNNKKLPKRTARIYTCRFCGKLFKSTNGQTVYCGKDCFSKGKLKFTRDQLIKAITQSAVELGRVPAKRELDEYTANAISLFGSWNEAVRAAGLEPHRSHDNRMYKRARTKALDGHYCDSVSEAIIDNWLYQNDIAHERDVHYPTGNFKSDWSLQEGKVFLEYFGLAQDSKRYDVTIKVKETICCDYGIKLISIFAKDLYPRPVFAEKLQLL